MTTARQFSFAGGEIAPALYGRTDVSKYAVSLRTCRNWMVMRHGGVSNRPGTSFVGEVKDSAAAVRLIPFVFNSSDQSYVLEFGNLYMRVHRVGAQVTLATQNITAATKANPCVVTYSGSDTYANGDRVYITGVVGMTELNNRVFQVANVDAGANTFELTDSSYGTNINSTSYGTWTSGGTIAEIYEITTPYVTADLASLAFVQSADVITIVHPSYQPRELSRTGHTSWTLSTITFSPAQAPPTAPGVTTTGAGTGFDWKYVVTALSEDGEESIQCTAATQAITAASKADPCVVTYGGADTYANGDDVYISGVVGMTELNGRLFRVANVDVGANTFELTDPLTSANIDSTNYTTYTSGGTVAELAVATLTNEAAPVAATPNVVTWTAASGAVLYAVYRERGVPTGTTSNGVFGFVGYADGTTFNDDGSVTPDFTDTPPVVRNPFPESGDWPSAVTYYQQRRIFANTNNEPTTFFASRTNFHSNMTISSPLQDDDAITRALDGRQVNEIQHLVDQGKLLALTTGGEWAISGDQAGILTTSSIGARQYSYNGSSTLAPININGGVLYVQARGSIVRDLAFDIETDGYRGNDLTVFSSHLFDGYTLTDWAYQQTPHSIIWAVRSDGTLIGMTYMREHELFAWHRHDFTDGTVENVCVVPEGTEDVLYVVVNRTIDGVVRRYVERMESRILGDIEDAIFVDSALSYDGWHTGATTMTLSGGTNWTYDETLTLTASAGYFTSDDVGNEIHLLSGTTLIRFEIITFTSTTIVTGKPNKTVPVAMRSVAIATWAEAVDQVTGLWHLEGENVSVFGDGFVAANPNNASYTTRTVTNGTVTFDAGECYAVIHIGLPITSDLETLDIDTVQGETLADKRKLITRVTCFVESTRGLFIGESLPSADSSQTGLTEPKLRNTEGYDAAVDLETGTFDVNIQASWNRGGRVVIRQTDPVPAAILSIAPAGLIPYR